MNDGLNLSSRVAARALSPTLWVRDHIWNPRELSAYSQYSFVGQR